ncbi:MAG: non-canonical purine NTP pyrophosphatase [Pirellulales bacterium]|nr:non-canonical purine NTP pyrophosphatase [Pirellulales bacterium]
MPEKPLLVLGTGNKKKAVELAVLFEPIGLHLATLADMPDAIEVIEDGETFAENSRKKAVEQARHLHRWVLGEDSGLAVDVLKGAPGVYSARYSGPDATDESNNRKLLEALEGQANQRRAAKYVCHMAISDPQGNIVAESEAACRGRILTEPLGTHGFGYDPLFEVLEYHRSFGQIGPTAKACLSHRARAARRLVPMLVELVDSGRWQ